MYSFLYAVFSLKSRVREGRDGASLCQPTPGTRFNSRVREGRDEGTVRIPQSFIMFQLTRPRGTRLPCAKRQAKSKRFQLTRPRGTRLDELLKVIVCVRFQLTRPRGTRRPMFPEARDARSFNSRVREGRDVVWGCIVTRRRRVSTHASARDATSIISEIVKAAQFQLTRPRGTRPN